MNPQCWSCCRFVVLDKDITTCIERFDGKPNQYFCTKCVAEREEKFQESFIEHYKHLGVISRI